jgi:hypothetical protein
MWRSAVIGLILTLAALLFGGTIENLATRVLKGRQRPTGWESD